jgi:hypothetical protein
MGALTGQRNFKVVAAVCIAVGVVVGAAQRVVAAEKISSALSCPHPAAWTANAWRPTKQQLHRQNNFCNADLRGTDLLRANLHGANLSFADLSDANLHGANLSGADLSDANLSGADLSDANLHGANLTEANLIDANLRLVNLTEAKLIDANLYGANLTEAWLDGAKLIDANLTKTKLAYADLTNAIYAPGASEPPDSYVAGIKGLDTLTLGPRDEIGLVQVRKLLQDAGLRDDERRATYSIQRNITRDQLYQFSEDFWSFGWFGGSLRYLGFDVTTAYGLYPWRALIEILVLGFLFTFAYMQPIRHPRNQP